MQNNNTMMKTTTLFSLMASCLLASTFLSAQSIWPGDLSDNGTVDGKDYLFWGYSHQATGPQRPDANGEWEEQTMGAPWAQIFPELNNYAYADANGDGKINTEDATTIKKHFKRTHGISTVDQIPVEDNAGPYVVYPTLVNSSLSLQAMSLTVSLKVEQDFENLYGFTFAFDIPQDLLQPTNGVLYNLTSSSFLFPYNSTIRSFVDYDAASGKTYVTVVKTDQEGVSGSGDLGNLIFRLRPGLRPNQINFPIVVSSTEVMFLNEEFKQLTTRVEPVTIDRDLFTIGGCPSTASPVCGSDGNTYLNSCYAEAAGVYDYTPGTCFDDSCIDPTQIDPYATCTTDYDPVCGCNGVTYANACTADAAGVVSTNPGPCATNDNCYDPIYVVNSSNTSVNNNTGVITAHCPTTYDPVCGCNGVTYRNSCLAEASGIRMYTPGSCESACIDPTEIDTDATCTTEYDPVCGCNGVTYTNPCRAEAAGLVTYTYGACNGSSAWCQEAIPVQCGDFLPYETTVGAGNNIVQYPGCTSNTFYGPDRVYVIEKTTIGDLQIGLEITTPGLDLDLFLLGDNCSQISCLRKSTTNNSSTNNEGIIYEDAPLGTYYIVVDAQHAQSQGSFRLEVSCGYLYCGDAVPLHCGQAYYGTNRYGADDVSLYACGSTFNVENNGPEIVHTFTTTEDGPVNINLSGLSDNLELFLLSSCDRGSCMEYSQNAGNNSEHISSYLPAGTYYVVVDGYNGAISNYTLQVDCSNACDLEIVDLTATASSCGQSNGSITIATSGGTPNYLITYQGPRSGSFTTNANTCTINYLPPGTYTVTKTDANGCSVSDHITIVGGGNLSVSMTPHDAVCMSRGSLHIVVSNGTAPYTVHLNGPTSGTEQVNSNNFTINDLDPGDYTVTITDRYGCSVSQHITIGYSSGDFIWNYTVTPATCGGYGAIHVSTYNGDPPYNIIVRGPVSGSARSSSSRFNLINLPGGTYEVTIEDNNWCQYTRTVVVPSQDVQIDLTANTGVCGQNGSITVNVSNGTPAYQIRWTGPSSGSTTTNSDQYTIPSLTSGTYTVYLTDHNGCTDSEVITLANSEGGNLDANVIPLDGACNQNGALWIDIYNGTPPYSISWSGPESGIMSTSETGLDIGNLPCGTYHVIISDANSCGSSHTVTIGGCDDIDIHLTPENGICGSDGSILVSISGGSPVYTVSWTGPENGSTTTGTNNLSIPDLSPGTYSVTVTGAGGCSDYAVTQVSSAESDLIITTTESEATCGTEGSIGVYIQGGVGPYQISWTGPESGVINTNNPSITIGNLSAGQYTIYVTDGNGCSGTKESVIRNTGSDLEVSLVGNDGICSSYGNIGVYISNGTAPYTITWSGPVSGSLSTPNTVTQIANTPAGIYTVVVTDANGCSTSGTVQVNTQNTLVASLTPYNGQCSGLGSIQVDISQGNPSYSISWTNGGDVNGAVNTAGSSYLITDLPTGNYSVVITDQSGCTRTLSTTINNGNGDLNISASLIYNICGQYNTIWVDIIGGTGPYTVTWTGTENGTGTTTTNGYEIMDLPPGTYKVTVVDANGCMAMQPDIIIYPSPVELFSVIPFNGVCGENGYLQVNIDGGTGPYTLTWNGPVSGTQSFPQGIHILNNLPSGTYTLTLVDANGCSESEIVVLTNGGTPVQIITSLVYNDCGQYNTIWVDLVGGTPPYTVTWTGTQNGSGTTSTNGFEIMDLPPGTYKVKVTDANGCMDMQSDIIIYEAPIEIFTATGQDGLCGDTGKITVDVTGGTAPYTLTYTGPVSNTQGIPAGVSVLTGFPSGTYVLTLTDANGCTESETVVINNNLGNPITINTSLIYNDCGQYNTIWVDWTGGTGPFTVTWTGGQNGSATTNTNSFEIMDLPPGTYKVKVTDVNGCMDMESNIEIYPSPVALFTATPINGTCSGPGAILVDITAGTAPYTLSWSGPVSNSVNLPNDNDYTITPLPAGVYTLTLIDANGCTEVEQVAIVSSEDDVYLTTTGNNATCVSPSSIIARGTGGDGTYTLTWTGPESGSADIGTNPFQIDDLLPGVYTLFLADGNGCDDTDQVVIATPENDLAIRLNPTAGACGENGQIAVTILGGTPSYTVSWSGPSSGSSIINGTFIVIPNLGSGGYTIVVTDSGGCTTSSSTTIQNGSGDVTVNGSGNAGQCGENGSINLTMSGGNGTYLINWSGPESGSTTVVGNTTTLTGLLSGTYNITVTSAGCSSGTTVFVGAGSPALQVSARATNANCGTGGSIYVSLSGTQGPTTISWNGPQSGSSTVNGSTLTIPNLPTGHYTITATNGLCTDITSVTVGSNNDNITVTATPYHGNCGGDGSIAVYISGGTAPYVVRWSGAESGTTTTNSTSLTIPNLSPGNYYIEVSSGNCTGTASTTINNNGNTLLLTATPQNGSCLDNPAILVQIEGGTAPYQLSWQGPISGTTNLNSPNYRIENLVAGFYSLSVVDANGCQRSTTAVLTDQDIEMYLNGQPGICGDNTVLTVSVSNGVGPYTITWEGEVSGVAVSNSPVYEIVNLPGGLYYVTVEDINGCTDTDQIILESGDTDFYVRHQVSQQGCGSQNNIWMDFYNGQAPYHIEWIGPESGETTVNVDGYDITELPGGTYIIIITDGNGCVDVQEVTVVNIPNNLYVEFSPEDGSCGGTGNIGVYVNGGTPGYVVEWYFNGQPLGRRNVSGNYYNITGLTQGEYFVLVTDANGCERSETFWIDNSPNALQLSTTLLPPGCTNDGSIGVVMGGGVAPYTVQWSGQASGNMTVNDPSFLLTGLDGGVYYINVTDANGCYGTTNVYLPGTTRGHVVADFDYTVDGLTVTLDNHASNGAYNWTFGDGNSSNSDADRITYTFATGGTYRICLQVSGSCGSDTHCESVTVVGNTALAMLEIGDDQGPTGSTISLPVRLRNADNIISMAGSVATSNGSVLNIVSVTPALIAPQFNAGNQTFSYYSNGGSPIYLTDDDDEVLFYFNVQLVGNPGQTGMVKWEDWPLPIEIGTMVDDRATTLTHTRDNGQVVISATTSLRGNVKTFYGEPLENAEIHIQAPNYDEYMMTDERGGYDMPDLQAGMEYTVSAARQDEATNGLSTYALFIGQRFLLGMEPEQIASPYQIIAGDANCNDAFTTLDLFLIQRLIIGAQMEFDNCPAWVFVSGDSEMPEEFDAYNVFPYADTHAMMLMEPSEANFVGVKIGDILGEADLDMGGRTTGDIVFNSGNPNVAAGEEVSLYFTSEAFDDIVSYQFGLGFDSEQVEFIEFFPAEQQPFQTVVAGDSRADEGKLRLSWYSTDGDGHSAAADTPLFGLRFRARTAINDWNEVLTVDEREMRAEAFNVHQEAFLPSLTFGTTITSTDDPVASAYALYQNTPNPFRETTTIGFQLPEAQHATLQLRDAFGKLVWEQQGDYGVGKHQVQLDRANLPAGVYHYTLQAGQYLATRSLVLIE